MNDNQAWAEAERATVAQVQARPFGLAQFRPGRAPAGYAQTPCYVLGWVEVAPGTWMVMGAAEVKPVDKPAQ